MRFLSLFPIFTVLTGINAAVYNGVSTPLHTSSRWILDSNNARVKFKCVNWPGHLETNTPEGLQHQPVDFISSWIAAQGFNCVRLTYSIDMALGQNVKISDSFAAAGGKTGVPAATFQSLYANIVKNNPWAAQATLIDGYSNVIDSLARHNVTVILDNHVSKAVWCCNFTDGNGWFSDSGIYVPANAQYFDTNNWLNGLKAMAGFAAQHPNVVGMSLRNEMRPIPIIQDPLHNDWYSHVTRGAQTIHGANSNLLIMIGGVNGATDISFLRTRPLDTSSWADRTVWEFHIYSFSVGYSTSNCGVLQSELGAFAGFLLEQGQSFTGPLWLSEFGAGMTGGNADTQGISGGDYPYLTCLAQYMENNDADWSVWVIGGDYYVREGTASDKESYGVMNSDWSDWQNPNFKNVISGMFKTTQGP